jgi:hypothetical protein
MKTLLVNGCSWTAGGGLDDNDTEVHIEHLRNEVLWPAHVKKLMNFDTQVNLAEGCGSNQRICRTTFDWAHKQDPETLRNTTAIIQWSCEDRYEYYVPTDEEKNDFDQRYHISEAPPETWYSGHDSSWDKSKPVQNYSMRLFASRWAKVNPGSVLSVVENHHDKPLIEDALSRYKTYTDQEGMYNWLFHMGFLYNFLTSMGVECYFWFFSQCPSIMPQHIQDYIYNEYPMLSDDRMHTWVYDRIGGEPHFDSHPSETGHAQLGQIIVDEIAKKKTILRRP